MSCRTDFSPSTQQDLNATLIETSSLLSKLYNEANSLSDTLQLEKPACLRDVNPLISTAVWLAEVPDLKNIKVNNPVWVSDRKRIDNGLSCFSNLLHLKTKCEQHFIPQALSSDLLSIRQGLVGRTDKWWRFLSPTYRQSKAKLAGVWRGVLPASSDEWLNAVDAGLEYQGTIKELESYQEILSNVFGVIWQSECSELEELSKVNNWIREFYSKITANELPISLAKLIDKGIDKKILVTQADSIKTLCNDISKLLQTLNELLQIDNGKQNSNLQSMSFSRLNTLLTDWQNSALLYDFARYNQIVQAFEPYNIKTLTELAFSWSDTPEQLMTSFELSYYKGLVNYAYDNSEAIRRFDRTKHERSLKEFKRIDGESLFFAQELLVNRLYERLPKKSAKGEMELVLRELGKKKRHIPIRKLLAGSATLFSK